MLAAYSGDTTQARQLFTELTEREKRGEAMAFFIGFVQYALGDMDAFVDSMERAFKHHDLPAMELQYSVLFQEARQDPRIADLLRRQRELAR